ncbi:MAG TPA: MarR family transcriptional regulator [Solirubrobacteraceae bacterium]
MAEFARGITTRPALVLVKLGNEVLARSEDPLAALGLSGRQYLVLAVLATDKPASQLELASLCGLLPAQIVPVLDALERRGLVARQRSEDDRRRSVVRLTTAGERTLAEADALATSIEDALFGDLEPAARERLDEALRAGLLRARPGGLADAPA